MALAFMTSPTELELEYTNSIDSLFCRFDPITFNEESYISLFTRSIQENNEHYELDGFLEACEKKENIHQLMWAYEKKVIEETKKKYSEIDKEFVNLEESIQKAIEINKCREELDTLKSRYAENESKLSLLENDSNELKSHNQNQMEMIRSIQSDDQKRISQYNDSILLPIKITETLAGIKIVEAAASSSGDYDQPTGADTAVADSENAQGDRISNSFDVMFLDLPDDCLNFEDKQGLPPNPQIKLSTSLLDKYRVIHRKRKQQANAQVQSIQMGRIPLRGLVVSHLSDFKTIYENFHTLLCSYLTKQEIQKASTRFGVDWIEGSPVISIILDSKATKMATLVLTKYFPMCGTSMIKLTSMTGYENSVIKNFRIPQNLGSLVEWMEQFIELYRTNQLE